MAEPLRLNLQYLTDEGGKKKAVVVPIEEFHELLEDLEDLAVIADRRDEETVSHETAVAALQDEGLAGARSYVEAGEYWDSHDLGEVWEKTEAVEIDVDLRSEKFYYSVEKELSDRITELAHARGVSPGTLVKLWLQEKAAQAS